jgi:hypothetical protein
MLLVSAPGYVDASPLQMTIPSDTQVNVTLSAVAAPATGGPPDVPATGVDDTGGGSIGTSAGG